MSAICTWFNALPHEVQGAIISAVATGLAAVIGILTVASQIRSQGRQSREAIAEGERRKMKASLYEEILKASRDVADSSIAFSNQLRMMNLEISAVARAVDLRLDFNTPSTRFPRLLELHEKFSSSTIRLILLIENRRIIDPRIIIFRTAMGSVLRDARQFMFSDAVAHVMQALPFESPNGSILPYRAPTVETADIICSYSDSMISTLSDAVVYTDDLLTEMQNLLLGDLFNRKIEPRTPIDPDHKVITLADANGLQKWFEGNTAWGLEIAEAEAAARARFAQEQTP